MREAINAKGLAKVPGAHLRWNEVPTIAGARPQCEWRGKRKQLERPQQKTLWAKISSARCSYEAFYNYRPPLAGTARPITRQLLPAGQIGGLEIGCVGKHSIRPLRGGCARSLALRHRLPIFFRTLALQAIWSRRGRRRCRQLIW
jgi:hypothetical protein